MKRFYKKTRNRSYQLESSHRDQICLDPRKKVASQLMRKLKKQEREKLVIQKQNNKTQDIFSRV
jgi:hypothetical protein